MKYEITYSCGHDGYVELGGKNSTHEYKLEFYRTQGLCPECYKRKKQAETDQIPLVLKISVDPYNVNTPINLAFTGNAYPVKDIIKSLGYVYCDCIGSRAFDYKEPEKLWNKDLPYGEEIYRTEIDKIKEAFPDIKIQRCYTRADIATMNAKLKEYQEKINQYNNEVESIPIPAKPGIYPKGHWNGKIYRNDTIIYVDNKAIEITPEEATIIKKYKTDIIDYNKKIQEIKNRYQLNID